MVEKTCQQCEQPIEVADAFCRACGTRVFAVLGREDAAAPTELHIDGAEMVDGSEPDDGRWQLSRAVLGLGAAILAVLIGLSVLSGLGDSGSDDDVATINETDGDETDGDEPGATPTVEPTATARPTTTSTATQRATEPGDEDSPTGSTDAGVETEEAEPEPTPDQVIDNWDDARALYDQEGVLAVRRSRSQVDLVDLATGRWQTVDTPSGSPGFSPTGDGSFATSAGIVTATGTQPTISPWDGSEPRLIGESGQFLVAVSEDIVVLGTNEFPIFWDTETTMTATELATGDTRTVAMANGFGLFSIQGIFGALSYPFAGDFGASTAIWTFDDGWTDVGPGNPIAASTGGVLVQTCSAETDGAMTCALDMVTPDGTRTAAHPDVAVASPWAAVLSPNLRWLASAPWPGGRASPYSLIDLETGSTVEGGTLFVDLGPSAPGVWLGDSGVFAMLGQRGSLYLTNAATGESVELEDVPWPPISPQYSNYPAIVSWLDMPMPASLPSAAE